MIAALRKNAAQPESPPKPPSGGGRLMSLDAFRGATIAAMMLVNNPGSWDAVYPQLDHAEWNGWTFTDIIFPFFLWIVGVAIPFSNGKRIEQGANKAHLFLHVARRTIIIFGLGFSLAVFGFMVDGSYSRLGGFSPWFHEMMATIRITGVLQRIAICYMVASAIYLWSGARGRILWLAGLLVFYWAMMKLVPVPGHGAGDLTPEGNLSAWIDSNVLGRHTWQARPWDPEGIFSTIPAIGTCLFGVLTGELLRMKRSVEQKTGWLFVAGNLLMLGGAVMNIWLPINKNLWTSTYAVFMAGLAMNVFGVFYWLIDVKGCQRWAKPFMIYGMNAITAFMLAGISGRLANGIRIHGSDGSAPSLKNFLYHNCVAGLSANPRIASLIWAIFYMVALYVVAWGMYRRKWFIKF